MKTLEKIYSVFAILFAFSLMGVLFLVPESRQLTILLPVGLFGVAINIGLMFIVLRDILCRHFDNTTTRFVWLAVILLFWPAVIYYLPRHGFRSR